MKNKRKVSLFLLLSLLMSCNELPDQNELPGQIELKPLPSSSIRLAYPTGIGTSGDTINGLLGYGYDATGFCDTISVKVKVFDSLPSGFIFFGKPYCMDATLFSGSNFMELSNKITNIHNIGRAGGALTQHLKSLLKLAYQSDSIDMSYAYYYFAQSVTCENWKLYHNGLDKQKYLSSDFKNDVVTLSPKELVLKYGTHVLTDLSRGTKFEVLYRCKLGKPCTEDEFEDLFFSRKNKFFKGYQYKATSSDVNTKLSQTSEQMIYNSNGSRQKLCGVINVTDYNPDSIRIDISKFFSEANMNNQIISVPLNGTLPIFELINDETKKQEVKAYIEKYMTTKTFN
jgi:hypothetical protein